MGRSSQPESRRRRPMMIAEKRKIALQAARGYLRRMDIDPLTVSADDALAALDDLHRTDRMLIASSWYGRASETQIKLFRREWNAWKKEVTL